MEQPVLAHCSQQAQSKGHSGVSAPKVTREVTVWKVSIQYRRLTSSFITDTQLVFFVYEESFFGLATFSRPKGSQ